MIAERWSEHSEVRFEQCRPEQVDSGERHPVAVQHRLRRCLAFVLTLAPAKESGVVANERPGHRSPSQLLQLEYLVGLCELEGLQDSLKHVAVAVKEQRER